MAEDEQATSVALNSESYTKPARKVKTAVIFWCLLALMGGGLFLRGCVLEKDPDEPGNVIEAVFELIPTGDEGKKKLKSDNPAAESTNNDLEIFNYSNEAPPHPVENVTQDFIITDIAPSSPDPAPPSVEESEADVTIDTAVIPEELSQEERLKRFEEGFTETRKTGGLVKRSDGPSTGDFIQNQLASGLQPGKAAAASSADPLGAAHANFIKRYYANHRPGKIQRVATAGGDPLFAEPRQGNNGSSPSATPGRSEDDLIQQLLDNNSSAEVPQEEPVPFPPSATQQAYDFVNNIDGQQSFRDYKRPENPYANSSVTKAKSPYILREGKIIKVIIDRALNTDEPGATSGLIQENIYDSIEDRYLLIPKGSRVMLSYNANVRPKQKRLQLRADRILFPNANSMILSGAAIHDEHGSTGLAEPLIDIDNHYDEIFKTFASNSIVDRVLGSASSLFSSDSAQSAKEAILTESVQKDLAKRPTITLNPGKIVYIILTRDIIMEPYIAS